MAITQKYNLNLIPNKMPLSVHVSQYDKSSRIIEFDLYNGATPFTIPSGSTITVRGGKPDGTGYEYACSYAAGTHGGSTVSATIEEQMTVLPGHQPAEIRITQGTQVLGTANFEFFVEASPMEEGAISETELPLLEDAIQAATRAETAAGQVEQTVEAVESIVPQSAGSAGQVLTNMGSGADWQDPIMTAADKEKLDLLGTSYEYKTTTSASITSGTWNEVGEITIKKPGRYIIQFGTEFETNATGRRAVMLRINGTATYYAYESQQAVSGAVTAMNNKVYINSFAANTVIKLMVFQTTGAALNILRQQLRAVCIGKSEE